MELDPPRTTLDLDTVLGLVDELAAARVWSELEPAFARFLTDLDPQVHPLVVLAGALVTAAEADGHVCVDLATYLAPAEMLLASAATVAGELAGALAPGQARGRTPGDERWAQHRVCLLLGEHEVTWVAWSQALLASGLVYDAAQPAELQRVAVPALLGSLERAPLVLAGTCLYLRRSFICERGVATRLLAMLGDGAAPQALDPQRSAGLSALLDALFARPGSEGQRGACELALRHRFTVITGGPGTGKTSTVARLLLALLWVARQPVAQASQGAPEPSPGVEARFRVHLAAPTGKAAARVTEAMQRERAVLAELVRPWGGEELLEGWPAETYTLHRLLKIDPGSGRFGYHPQQPLLTDVVVVDEASMIDVRMMWGLLRSLPPQARLVLLGDRDQLASVEAGSVLAELCSLQAPSRREEGLAESARSLPVAVLEHSHRFPAASALGQLARAVNAGDSQRAHALLRAGGGAELIWMELDGKELGGRKDPFERLVVDGCRPWLERVHAREELSAGSGPLDAEEWAARQQHWAAEVLAALEGFQILCAQRPGAWGVEQLNQRCVDILRARRLIHPTAAWYSGRPVMVTRNDYASGLMNGDVGVTLLCSDSPFDPPVLRVAFRAPNGGIVFKSISRLAHVETVFCMTVHKAQGSEFDHVVLVLPERSSALITRELVYTGVSRARVRYAGGRHVSGRCTLVTAPVLGGRSGEGGGSEHEAPASAALGSDAPPHVTLQAAIGARVQRVSGLAGHLMGYLEAEPRG